MKIYFSTSSFTSRDITSTLANCQENGLTNIELGSSVLYSDDIIAIIHERRHNFNFLVHNYFPPPSEPFVLNLASTDPVIHRQSIDLCRGAIDLCAELGVPFYSVHAGFAFHLTPAMLGDPVAQSRLDPSLLISREKAYEIFVETVRELSQYALRKNIQFLIENNVVTKEFLIRGRKSPLLLADTEEITRFFADVKDSNIGLLLDAGHAKVTATAQGVRPESFFEDLGPYVRALHLSDNDGTRDTHQSFDGNVWFAPFLKDMASLPMVVEVYRMPLEKMLKQRQILEQLIC